MIRLDKWLLLLTILLSNSAAAQNLFDLDHSRAYASHLFRSGQYSFAANEYERIVFMSPGDTTARLRLVQSYRLSQDFDHAITRNLELNGQQSNILPATFAREYSLSLLADGQQENAEAFMLGENQLMPPDKDALLLGMYILQADWNSASSLIGTTEMYPDPLYTGLHQIAVEGSSLKYKSPGLALVMSTLVPGTGKMYAGQWGDGFIALAFVGTNAWQSYRGFKNEGIKSPYGWVFGTLALAFYAGDIYGSFAAVKRYNHSKDAPIRDQAYHLLFDTP